jgi:hypothetical protein
VVSDKDNTEKVYLASRRPGVHVVNRRWLLFTYWYNQR